MSIDHRPRLPTVTLCAASSVNLAATIEALDRCLEAADFADCLLFTDGRIDREHPHIRPIAIPRMKSSSDYSRFMLRDLVGHVHTTHVLIVQWDGFILDGACWDDSFLQYDYIGAPWPQFADAHDVGNGGFSLRSKRLLEACQDPEFVLAEPEDVAICRINRRLLEEKHGLRFAPRPVADRFAFERTTPSGPVFGFHGIFNMIDAIGEEAFWATYSTLDELSSARRNHVSLFRQLRSTGSRKRRARLIYDRFGRKVRKSGGDGWSRV